MSGKYAACNITYVLIPTTHGYFLRWQKDTLGMMLSCVKEKMILNYLSGLEYNKNKRLHVASTS
jgi:hypothetical protein